MQESAPGNSRSSITLTAIVCGLFIVVTFVVAEMKPWTRKPADAGVCNENSVQWQRKAIQGKLAGLNSPDFRSKAFAIQQGAHWDDKNRNWVVPFRISEQSSGTKNFTALVHCTGSVEIKPG